MGVGKVLMREDVTLTIKLNPKKDCSMDILNQFL